MTPSTLLASVNGVFNTGLSFWELIGLIGATVLAIVTIKVVVSFDINKFLERKDKRLMVKKVSTWYERPKTVASVNPSCRRLNVQRDILRRSVCTIMQNQHRKTGESSTLSLQINTP